MMLHLAILSLLLISSTSQPILSSSDFTSGLILTQSYVFSNYAGLSIDFAELFPYLTNANFQSLLLNSNIYGDWGNNFVFTVHMPRNYLVNCTLIR